MYLNRSSHIPMQQVCVCLCVCVCVCVCARTCVCVSIQVLYGHGNSLAFANPQIVKVCKLGGINMDFCSIFSSLCPYPYASSTVICIYN